MSKREDRELLRVALAKFKEQGGSVRKLPDSYRQITKDVPRVRWVKMAKRSKCDRMLFSTDR